MDSKKPYVAALLVQLTFAGLNMMYKAAFSSGMSSYVFIFYRQVAGTIVLVPTTLFFKRNESVPLSLVNLCKIFGIALIGTTVSETYGVAVDYTSASYGAAASNCIPVSTFFFAVLFRMEKVNIRTRGGFAKVVGIVMCSGGVAILTFYKGHYFKPLFTHQFFHHAQQLHHHPATSTKTWILGCFFLVISTLCFGIWLVLQAHFLKHFPGSLDFVCLQTVMSTIQSLVVAVAMERDPSQWELGWNIRLFALVYCGIFIVGVGNTLQCWVIKQKGPVFLAMTTPLELVATIIGSGFLLSEGIYLGSILGALVLVISLYSVLWGKTKDPIDTPNREPTPTDQLEMT